MNKNFNVIAICILILCNSCHNSDLLSDISSTASNDEYNVYSDDNFLFDSQNILQQEGDNPLIICGLYPGYKAGKFPYQYCANGDRFRCFLWFPILQYLHRYLHKLQMYDDQILCLASKNEFFFRMYIPKTNEDMTYDIEQNNGWNIFEEIPISDPYSLVNIGSSRILSILPNFYEINDGSYSTFFQIDVSYQYGDAVLVVISNSSIKPLKEASSIYGEDVLIGYIREADIVGNEFIIHIPQNALGNSENTLYSFLYNQSQLTLDEDCVFDEPYVQEFFSSNSNIQLSISEGAYPISIDSDTIENGLKILCSYNIN